MPKPEKEHADYTVAWICALPLEGAAARTMLDKTHSTLPQPATDQNVYTLGELSGRNVVIACLPSGVYGTVSAAVVVSQLLATFTKISFALLVGIGGGIPRTVNNDMRLGDIVVSKPTSEGTSGVIAYDSGKRVAFDGDLQLSAVLNRPPQLLLNTISRLEADTLTGNSLGLREIIASKCETYPNMAEQYLQPDRTTDYLFEADYSHLSGASGCDTCDPNHLVNRPTRTTDEPRVHYGTIASGNQLIRDAASRDRLGEKYGALCFEMEAAGMMNQLPCLVIRGICDFCDSHKSKAWQGYAAMTAAAYGKTLLSRLPMVVDNSPGGSKPEPVFMVQFGRNPRFLGREAELSRLEAMVLGGDRVTQKAAISGLGGVGKTQIALELSYRLRHRETPYSIFWISSTSAETLEQGFVQMANRLGLGGRNSKDIRARVVRHLSSESATPWILIIDNADDMELWPPLVIKEAIPVSEHGFTLFTTRNHQLAIRLVGPNVIRVAEMDPPLASTLLKSVLYDNSKANDMSALALAEHLHALPLAIIQAASYINENQISIDTYLSLLENTEDSMVELLSEDFGDEWRYADIKNPITSTWLVSFNQVERLNPQASDYLSFMSSLGSASIPISLLPTADSKIKQQSALGLLKAYHFITEHSDYASQIFTLHRLVRLATRNWLRAHGNLDNWVTRAGRRLGAVFPSAEQKNRALWRPYLPHALYVLDCEEFQANTTDRDHLKFTVARTLWRDERYSECIPLFKELYQEWKDRLGIEDEDTLLAMEWASIALADTQQWKEAETLQLELQDVRQRILGPDNALVLKGFGRLARMYRYQGRLQEAFDLGTEVVRKMRSLYGDADAYTLDAIMNLVGTCRELSTDMEDLIDGLRAAIKSLAPEASDMSRVTESLAEVYIRQGRLKEAETLLEEYLEKTPYAVDEHSDPRGRLVSVYRRQGKHREAEELAQRAWKLAEATLGPEHPTTSWRMLDVATGYLERGRLAEAESLQKEAVEKMKLVIGYGHADTLTAMWWLAKTKEERGDMAGAEEILVQVSKLSYSAFGQNSLFTLKVVSKLSSFYYHQERYAEAEKLGRDAVEGRKKLLGEDHPTTLLSMWRLAPVIYKQGKLEESIQLLEDCNRRQAQRFGQDHSDTQKTTRLLAGWKEQREWVEIEASEGLAEQHGTPTPGDPEASLEMSTNSASTSQPLAHSESDNSTVARGFVATVRTSVGRRWRRFDS
jgi:nucleoside phosphorylase/tetratricopeptide (TPR) repeat protein